MSPLLAESVALRRIPAEELGHVREGHAALRALRKARPRAGTRCRRSRPSRARCRSGCCGRPLLSRSRSTRGRCTIQSTFRSSTACHSASTSSRGRIGGFTLAWTRALAVDVEEQVADRHLARKRMCGKTSLHHQRRFDRLARREVQQVDVEALGLVGEVRRRSRSRALRSAAGARRCRRAAPSGWRRCSTSLRVGGEDVGELAVQADADRVAQAPDAAPSAGARRA